MKEITTFQLSLKVNGAWKTSKEYPTVAELFAASAPYLQKSAGKFTNMTLVRNVRVVAVQ